MQARATPSCSSAASGSTRAEAEPRDRAGDRCRARSTASSRGTRPAYRADGSARAGVAGPVEHDLVVRDPERDPPAELADHQLELLVGERQEPPAAIADEMMVVLMLAPDCLEAGGALARVHAL